jgi:hypothetical protein
MWVLPKNYQLSSAFAADMVESKEDLTLPGLNIESSLMWRSKPSPLRTWSTRWKQGSYLPHLFTRILKPSQRTSFETALTSSLEVIRASRFQQQDSEREPMIHDTCGLLLGDTLNQLDLFRCFFENVEGHISLGLSTVISDLEEDGYRATWGIFSAREVGAPHLGRQSKSEFYGDRSFESVADTSGEGLQGSQWLGKARKEGISRGLTPECSDQLADTICSRSETGIPGQERYNKERDARVSINCGGEHGRWQIGMPWPPEPRLGRVVDGCADRVDRIRMLGNGVVPQTAAKAYLTLKVRGLK